MQAHHTDLCAYPKGIEHADIIEKVEVEIETKVTLRQEPYENRQRQRQRRHELKATRRSLRREPQMDTIDIYIYPFKLIISPLSVWFFELIRAPLFVFFFLSDSRIVYLSLLISQATKVGIRTYESNTTLRSRIPPHLCMMYVVCMGQAQDVRRNKKFCLLFIYFFIP